jgi:hypothetical protein
MKNIYLCTNTIFDNECRATILAMKAIYKINPKGHRQAVPHPILNGSGWGQGDSRIIFATFSSDVLPFECGHCNSFNEQVDNFNL